MEEVKTKTTRRSMSAKKTTTTKRTKAKKETVAEETVTPVTEEQEMVEEVTEERTKKEFKSDDEISTKSVFAGSCTLIGRRTGNVYVWEDLGEYQDVEYQDLLAEIKNHYSKYIYEPLILIEDEDLISNFPKIEKMYENMMDTDELTEAILNDEVQDLKDILISLPTGLKESVKNIVSTLIQNGELYDVRKIRLVDDLFGTALLEQMNLYN